MLARMSEPCEASSAPRRKRAGYGRIAILVGVPLFFVTLWLLFPVQEWLTATMAWMERQGPMAGVYYVLFYIVAVVTLVPDVVVNASAGVLWGVALGTVLATIGRTLGAGVTFVLVRKLMHRWLARKMAEDAQFAAIERAIARRGFRITLLLRLCPLVPVNLGNFGLGLTKVSLPAYLAGTAIGLLPRTMVVAYFGAGGRTIASVANGGPGPETLPPLLFWGGLAFTIVATVLVTHQARRALNEALATA